MKSYVLIFFAVLAAAASTASIDGVDEDLNLVEPKAVSWTAFNRVKGDTSWKSVIAALQQAEMRNKLARKKHTTTTPLAESTTSSRPHAVGDYEKLHDKLHEHTGEKQPYLHSAVDGWIF